MYERAAGGPRRARVPISICFFLIHLTVDQSTALLSVVVVYTVERELQTAVHVRARRRRAARRRAGRYT